jgi:predicted aldo/keto reductase-like oxidoreductase
MKYRKFGRFDWDVSVLGFGVMRLPLMDKDPANINESESIEMIRTAIDHGVNYLDLGHPYNEKQYERLIRMVGQALQDGYRQKIKVTTTLPTFSMNASPDFDQYLNEQLQWLQVDKIDFYLLGRLNRENWPKLKRLGLLNWAEQALSDGRVDNLGFSFHDHFQVLRDILDAYDKWSLCQFQYGYMDMDHDPGLSGIKYAAEKGLAVVVTEPLRWGMLTEQLPESVAKIWERAPEKRSLTEWGLHWVWNYPEVSVAVCAMSTIEQVIENITIADSAEPDSLTVRELVLINQVREAYLEMRPIPCTSCRACMPCEMGIDVPRIFELYNDAIIYGDIETARSIYCLEKHHIDSCTECDACENACVKRIAMLDCLKVARQLFDECGE